jgi:hypothetical protein
MISQGLYVCSFREARRYGRLCASFLAGMITETFVFSLTSFSRSLRRTLENKTKPNIQEHANKIKIPIIDIPSFFDVVCAKSTLLINNIITVG